MHAANRFETRTTYRLLRLEYLVGLVVSVVLFGMHFGEVRWLPAVALFVSFDLIGYVPGDSLLDICVIDGPHDPAEMLVLARAGQHVTRPGVIYARGRTVTIERTDGHPAWFEHDGEVLLNFGHRFTLDVVPHAIPMLVGPPPTWAAATVSAEPSRESRASRPVGHLSCPVNNAAGTLIADGCGSHGGPAVAGVGGGSALGRGR